jgi:hypothetical protein
MSLKQWLANSWIRQAPPNPVEISSLLNVARRDIADGGLEGISPDGRFDQAYEAVRTLCEVALLACGYQVPKGARKHELLIASLQFTLDNMWTGEVDFLDYCRRQRHQSLYDRVGVVQRSDADELLAMAKRLSDAVRRWLAEEHPELVK